MELESLAWLALSRSVESAGGQIGWVNQSTRRPGAALIGDADVSDVHMYMYIFVWVRMRLKRTCAQCVYLTQMGMSVGAAIREANKMRFVGICRVIYLVSAT